MKPAFAILRTAKLKSLGNVSASLSHTYRTRETPNADPQRQGDNRHSHGTPAEVLKALQERLPDKRRKDAVLGIEYFVGASPEWFKGRDRAFVDDYFAQSLDWLRQRHGAENVVGWSIHRDESSPHLVAYVVPRDGDTLNAKKWLGGRAALSLMQSDFVDKVARHHELARGIEGSKAKHQTIKGFYAEIGRTGQHLTITPDEVAPKVVKKGLFKDEHEAPEVVAARLTKAARQAYAPAVEGAKLAASERRRASEMRQTAQSLEMQKKTLQNELAQVRERLAPFAELADNSPGEFAQLAAHAQQRVNALKAAKERAEERARLDAERRRRVEELERVESKTAGASCTFARRALQAIRQAGKADAVDWPKVEQAAIVEAIRENGQKPGDVLAAIVKHSPGMVEQERQEAARVLVQQVFQSVPVVERTKERDTGPKFGL